MRPQFYLLREIAAEFGLERLNREWDVLRADPLTDARRVEPTVTRILTNLRRGLSKLTQDLAAMAAPSPLADLFRTTAIACANRCISSDWIALYRLFRDHGFSLADFTSTFHREGVRSPERTIDWAFGNLCRGVKSIADPGDASDMENPPTLEEIAEFFRTVRDEYEASAGGIRP